MIYATLCVLFFLYVNLITVRPQGQQPVATPWSGMGMFSLNGILNFDSGRVRRQFDRSNDKLVRSRTIDFPVQGTKLENVSSCL